MNVTKKLRVVQLFKGKPFSIEYRCGNCATESQYRDLYCSGCGRKFNSISEVVRPR